MGAKQFSQKGGNRHYRGPAMSGAFQGVHSVQLIQKELGLSFSNAGYWLGTLNQFISSDSQLTHLQNGGNNSASPSSGCQSFREIMQVEHVEGASYLVVIIIISHRRYF